MSIPNITFDVAFPVEGVSKLSNVTGYNYCDISFSCDKNFNIFICRATLENSTHDIDIGTLVYEMPEGGAAGATYTFALNSNEHLLEGEANYRVSLYVQDESGVWNESYFFIVSDPAYYKVTEGYFKVVDKRFRVRYYINDISSTPTIYYLKTNGSLILSSPLNNGGYYNSEGKLLSALTEYVVEDLTSNLDIIAVRNQSGQENI